MQPTPTHPTSVIQTQQFTRARAYESAYPRFHDACAHAKNDTSIGNRQSSCKIQACTTPHPPSSLYCTCLKFQTLTLRVPAAPVFNGSLCVMSISEAFTHGNAPKQMYRHVGGAEGGRRGCDDRAASPRCERWAGVPGPETVNTPGYEASVRPPRFEARFSGAGQNVPPLLGTTGSSPPDCRRETNGPDRDHVSEETGDLQDPR